MRIKYKQKSRQPEGSKEKLEVTQWLSLRNLLPEEWVQRVEALPAKARPQIARMVWWDFFSERTVLERWPHFDHYLQFDENEDVNPLSRTMIAKCLKAVGYPKYRIKLRLLAA